MKKLYFWFYHLLWIIWPKNASRIEGLKIQYVSIPIWLNFCGFDTKKKFDDAKVITKQSTKKVMIFMCKGRDDPTFRYTLYHEYLEGTFKIGLLDQDWAGIKFDEASNLLASDIPDLHEKIGNSLDRSQDREHLFALVLELALAKKEMLPTKFKFHLEYAMIHRL